VRVAIGADHAGFDLKKVLIGWARENNLEVLSFGAEGHEPCDYPDVAAEVVGALRNNRVDFGVLCCGTGIGMSIAANRYRGIRAALCFTPEMAELARNHNHANILCLGARTAENEDSLAIFKTFLETNPSKEIRHTRRVAKLDQNE
jgi:ribose 5-phosphate isomerase B